MTNEWIKTNKLKGTVNSTSASDAKQVYYGSSKKYRMYYGSTIIWDVLKTTFTASNFTIGADGGSVATAISSYVTSYGTDVLGTKETISYTVSPTTISANSTSDKKTHTITVTQSDTGDLLTVTCTLDAKEVTVTGYEYTTTVSSTSIGPAAASGGTLTLKVSGTIYKYEVYSDGTKTLVDNTTFSNVTATIIDGYDVSSRAYLSNGKIVVHSAGSTTYTGTRNVYYVYEYSFSINNSLTGYETKTFSKSTSITVKQSQNSSSTSWGDELVTITAASYSATSAAKQIKLTVNAVQEYTTTYTSGYEDTGEQDITASIYIESDNDSDSLTKTSVTGSGTLYVNVAATVSSSSRYIYVYAETDDTIDYVRITQTGRTVSSTTYGTPSVTSTSVSAVAASGNVTRYLTVYWSQTKTITYDNGTTSSSTVTGSSTATVLSGNAQNSSGAYINSGGVYVPSAGTTYFSSTHNVYYISSYEYYANNKRGTGSGVYVTRYANTYTTTYKNYTVSLTPATKYLAAYEASVSISVSATKDKWLTYSSGSSEYNSTVGTKATLSSSYGTFYNSGSYTTSVTVSNGGSTTFYASENTGTSERNITVKGVNYDSSSTSTTLTLIQNPAEFELKISPVTVNLTASGGTASFDVISTKNGNLLELTTSNVSATGGYVSLTLDDILMDRYKLEVLISSHTSTSSRTFYVDVTQPNSGNTVRGTIVQAAASSGGGSGGGDTTDVTVDIDCYFESYYTVYYMVSFNVPSDYFTGDVEIRVQDSYYEDGKSYGNQIYEGDTFTDGDAREGYIDVSERVDPMYLAVYIDNVFINAKYID